MTENYSQRPSSFENYSQRPSCDLFLRNSFSPISAAASSFSTLHPSQHPFFYLPLGSKERFRAEWFKAESVQSLGAVIQNVHFCQWDASDDRREMI